MLGGAQALKIIRFAPFVAESLAGSPEDRRRGFSRELLAALLAVLVVAGSYYWTSIRTGRIPPAVEQIVGAFDRSAPTQVAQPIVVQEALPPPVARPLAPREEALEPRAPAPTPASTPAPPQIVPERAIEEAKVSSRARVSERPSNKVVSPKSARGAVELPRTVSEQNVSQASTQSVSIGRFTTKADAEKGWATILNQWPGMRSLSVATVSISSLRDGKTYYRLQVGTSSRAHSEVLCQRAHDLDQSCTVNGYDGKAVESPL